MPPYLERRLSTSHRRVGHTKTHVKKYTKFSCNKMAVSDRRPLSLIFAEEETTVLYTAIPNSTNSKNVAGKTRRPFFNIYHNRWLRRTRKPMSPSIATRFHSYTSMVWRGWNSSRYSWMVRHVLRTRRWRVNLKRIVDHDPEEYADRNGKENTIHKCYLRAKHQASLKGHSGSKKPTLFERLNNTQLHYNFN